jgi:DNA-directed RNA polymerase specialized sigma subunit
MGAIDRFDRERGNSFTSYAIPTITGVLRRQAGQAHTPRSLSSTS